MAEGITADTSSYKLPTTSPFDIAKNIGGLEQQRLGITQQKLDQAEQAVNYLSRGMSAIGPNGTPEQYERAAADTAKLFNLPPQSVDVFRQKMLSYKNPQTGQFDSSRFYDELQGQRATHIENFNQYRGQLQATPTGQGTQYTRIPGSPNIPVAPVGSVQQQISPSEKVLNPRTKEPELFGNEPTAPFVPGGGLRSRIAPPATPGAMNPMPAQGGRVPGPTTGLPPDYEAGLKQFASDQEMSTQKLTAIKPALQALPLAQDLTTGIGTETYNKVLAAAHNLGILPQGMTNKLTLYQEINKKMADYVRSNPVGQRSDAAQALSEAASPSPKAQINPALIKLTQDAIALDRVQAIRSMGFSDEKGNQRIDYNNYGKHRSEFPAKIDERALKIDIMKPEERKKLLDEMEKKQNTFDGKKFKYTLDLADKIGLFDMNR